MRHSAKETLERARGRENVNEDEEAEEIELRSPATADRIAALEASLPGPLPAEVKDLRAFASEVPDDALVVDLRGAEPGDGFAWGCFGPRTEIRRCGDELLFALVPPPAEEPRRRGLLSRLLGR